MATMNKSISSASTTASQSITGTTNVGNTISISPSTYSYGTLSNTISSLYINGHSDLSYLAREMFQNEDVSETTIRSIIMDMKATGKSDEIDFSSLLTYRTLSEKFLNDFYDKFDKYELYTRQEVSLDFIKKHLPDIKNDEKACEAISYSQRLTEEFIELFSNHINWAGIAENKHIKFTVSFLLKYIDKFDDIALKSLCKNDAINTGVFNAFLENVPEEIRYRLDWEAISWCKDLTEENILNNLDFIDFNSLLLATRKFKDDVITCFRKVKFGI